jgi:hypothetical protein
VIDVWGYGEGDEEVMGDWRVGVWYLHLLECLNNFNSLINAGLIIQAMQWDEAQGALNCSSSAGKLLFGRGL